MKNRIVPAVLAAAVGVGMTPLLATAADVYSGNISEQTYINEGAPLWGKVVTKNLVLEPGKNQFSIDSLGMTDRLVLTLHNPTDTPLHFETSKVLGDEQMVTVPAYSTRVVSFVFKKPISDEVEYLVMQDVDSAKAAIANPPTTTAAFVPTVTQPSETVVNVYQNQPETAQQPAPATQPEVRQAVRGYW